MNKGTLEAENAYLRHALESATSKCYRFYDALKATDPTLADSLMYGDDDKNIGGVAVTTGFQYSPPPSSASTSSQAPSTPTSLRSPVSANERTGADSLLKPPVRVIDEDYDEGVDYASIRRYLVRNELASRYGISDGMSADETLDKIVQHIPERWSI